MYDSLGQLTRENNQAAGKTWTWSYDTGGNILSRSEYAYTTGELGEATDTVSYTYGDATWGDLLTAYDGSAITYDGGGNMTAYDGWTFTWQGGRQLAGMSNGTTTLSFDYNESGLRTKKSDGTTTHSYIYRGEQLIADVTTTDALYFRYDQNGDILGFSYNGAEYTYVKNLQGDILAILDSSGSVVASYTYDAWGNILSSSGTLAERNPFSYRGYVYDNETGLYYLQSRYYNPQFGRFVNADDASLLGATGDLPSYNLYGYRGNNPVSRADDGGKAWGVVVSAAIGGAFAGAIMGAVSHLANCGLNGTEVKAKELMGAIALGAGTGAIGAAAGAITKPIQAYASAAAGIITGVAAGIKAEGGLKQKVAVGVAAGITAGVGTYLGTKLSVPKSSKLATGFTAYASGLYIGGQTEIVSFLSQKTASMIANFPYQDFQD